MYNDCVLPIGGWFGMILLLLFGGEKGENLAEFIIVSIGGVLLIMNLIDIPDEIGDLIHNYYYSIEINEPFSFK